jgi:hypothetical protein
MGNQQEEKGVWQYHDGICWLGDNKGMKGNIMVYVDKFQCCLGAQLFGARLVLTEVWKKGFGHGDELCTNRVLTPHKPTMDKSLSSPAIQPKVEEPNNAELTRVREEVIGKMKESRANAAKLLALHEEEKNRLTIEYERRQRLYAQGLIRSWQLKETERDLAEAITRVEQDKRWMSEADIAIKKASRDCFPGPAIWNDDQKCSINSTAHNWHPAFAPAFGNPAAKRAR